MNNIENQKSCTNCAHFSVHYFRAGRFFLPTDCGICQKKRVTDNAKKLPLKNGCANWEPLPEKKKTELPIKQLLKEINKNLEIVVNLLNIR